MAFAQIMQEVGMEGYNLMLPYRSQQGVLQFQQKQSHIPLKQKAIGDVRELRAKTEQLRELSDLAEALGLVLSTHKTAYKCL